MIIKDDLSLSTSEKEGFQYFSKIAVPLWKPPSRWVITKRLEDKYNVMSLKVKNIFANIPAICLTMDAWTETHTTNSFLGVTAHFLEDVNIKSATLGIELLTERHTIPYLTTKIEEFCNEWQIDISKVSACVTDNAANIVGAARAVFGKDKHLACFAHTLNLIPAAALGTKKVDNVEVANVPGIPDLIKKVKKIVTFSHTSYNFSNDLKSFQKQNGAKEGTCLRLIQDVSTRWSSTYEMCERFLRLIDVVGAAAVKYSEVEMLTGVEIATLTTMKDLLEPFAQVTTEVSSEKNSTSSKIIPLISLIKEVS